MQVKCLAQGPTHVISPAGYCKSWGLLAGTEKNPPVRAQCLPRSPLPPLTHAHGQK